MRKWLGAAVVALLPLAAPSHGQTNASPVTASASWHGFARLPGQTWKTWLMNSGGTHLYVDKCWWGESSATIECDRTFPDGQTKRITYKQSGNTVILEGAFKNPVTFHWEPDGSSVSSREYVAGDRSVDRSYFYWPEMIITDVSSRSFKGRILSALDSFPGQADGIHAEHTRDYNTAGAGAPARTFTMEEALAHIRAEAEVESAEFEAHFDRVNNMPASGTGVANAIGGFMKGFSEETAKNLAMEQSMQNAANRGLAQGAAEYARRNGGAASSSSGSGAAGENSHDGGSGSGAGLVIENAEPAPRPSAPSKATNGPYYAACVAVREGGGEGSTYAGAVYFSEVAQVAESFDSGHSKILKSNFLADIGARYGKYNFGHCVYVREANGAREAAIEGPRNNHRGKEMVDTGIMPRLN